MTEAQLQGRGYSPERIKRLLASRDKVATHGAEITELLQVLRGGCNGRVK